MEALDVSDVFTDMSDVYAQKEGIAMPILPFVIIGALLVIFAA